MTHDIDGLWTVEFGSNEGISGGGVVVFQNGKIVGGDATHFYLGEYTLDGSKLKATLKVSPFIAGAQSVFKTVGRDHILDLVGSLTSEEQAIAQGAVREAPQLAFGAKLTKRSLISGAAKR